VWKIRLFSVRSNEYKFLTDFVKCAGNLSSSGGRLARWLQPEPFIEPRLCQVIYSRQNMHCGWPTTVTVITRDQYGQVAQAVGLKVRRLSNPLTVYRCERTKKKFRDALWLSREFLLEELVTM
jgi:E3 ubiquitin-protein ligase MYCBP2